MRRLWPITVSWKSKLVVLVRLRQDVGIEFLMTKQEALNALELLPEERKPSVIRMSNFE